MTKNQLRSFGILTLLAILVAACGGNTNSNEAGETTEAEETAEILVSGDFILNRGTSEVAWKGEVAGVYGHNGVINIQDGAVTLTNGKISAGNVTIDMTSIQPLDTASYEASGKTPQDLVDHLSTGDFFLVEEFPTATFVIKSHDGNRLVGDLTIRGNTNEEVVELNSFEVTENGLTSSGKLVFDRQKYDVKWEHYIEDYVLSDDIEITLNIVAEK